MLAKDEDFIYVTEIVNEVKKRGDLALIKFTSNFDNVNLTAKDLRVKEEAINKAYEVVSREQIVALKYAKDKIESFEKKRMENAKFNYKDASSCISVNNIFQPLSSVGCYVPGGKAAYPSTALMTTIPAKVAGVPRVILCSPPSFNGEIHPLTLIAADIVGVDEIYRVGGAQAIAAMAYGTESIRSVIKIVGPGSKIVTFAKILVSRNVAIDMPAGPSEIIVLADDKADAKLIALDLISQAEHDPNSISGLITDSKKLAHEVTNYVNKMVPDLPRHEIIIKSLSENGFIAVCDTLSQAVDFINDFAPEHLEIITQNASEIAEKITSAGLILLGAYTPVSASDYCIGTNHVLPAGGFGHIYSGLSVFDFIRKVSIVECTQLGLEKMQDTIRVLAESEGLPNHYLAIKGRLNSD